LSDQCPGCGTNHLDLFPDAFAKLAEPSKGIIDVTWSVVDCGITSPITLKNKEGTSKYWFAMQVVNSNVAVSKLEVSTNGGSTWQPTTRTEYNYFQNASGFGTDTVDVKITSTKGKSITVKGVSVAASSTKTAPSNF
jgi:expansin (peptidoglycan-binding protein)